MACAGVAIATMTTFGRDETAAKMGHRLLARFRGAKRV